MDRQAVSSQCLVGLTNLQDATGSAQLDSVSSDRTV